VVPLLAGVPPVDGVAAAGGPTELTVVGLCVVCVVCGAEAGGLGVLCGAGALGAGALGAGADDGGVGDGGATVTGAPAVAVSGVRATTTACALLRWAVRCTRRRAWALLVPACSAGGRGVATAGAAGDAWLPPLEKAPATASAATRAAASTIPATSTPRARR
jgi:hypothetical protein